MSCLPFEVVESLMAFTEGVRQTSNAPSHPADIASFICSLERFSPWCLGTSVLYLKFVGHRRELCPCKGPELTMSSVGCAARRGGCQAPGEPGSADLHADSFKGGAYHCIEGTSSFCQHSFLHIHIDMWPELQDMFGLHCGDGRR